MKKIFIIIGILVVVLVIGILLSQNSLNHPKKETFFISYSDGITKAKIVQIKTSDLDKELTAYQQYNYLKTDKITSIDKISIDTLKYIVSSSKNSFNYGIIFDNNTFLLSEEINSNNIIDYTTKTIDFNNLKQYLKEANRLMPLNFPKKISIFKTESTYYENNQKLQLSSLYGYNIRYNDSKEAIKNIIDNATERLITLNKEGGEFIYGKRANTNAIIDDYNILRHAGTTWSLILKYSVAPTDELKETIIKSLKYLVDNYLVQYNDEISFIIEKKSSEIKLGANALTLLALTEYMNVFNDFSYQSLATNLANGILYLQDSDGSFRHVLNLDFSLKEKSRTVYYDGESTLALLKFYGLTKNNKYLQATERVFDYLIANNYEKYRDHWIAHSLNEYSRYVINDKYIKFAFLNFTHNSQAILDFTTFNPTSLELLTATTDLYNFLKRNNYQSDIINNFDITYLNKVTKNRLDFMLNSYIYPEVAMYFHKPNDVIYGFYSKDNNFRMRIDDIQHAIIALIFYCYYL